MNKYIRVEDGIYEIFDTHNGCSNHFGYKYSEYCTILLDEEDIKNYRQADTVEELCDEFVGYVDGCIPFIWKFDNIDKYREKDLFIKEIIKNKDEDETIYGAIWTKGEHDEPILKSAAKMNDEGGLELL